MSQWLWTVVCGAFLKYALLIDATIIASVKINGTVLKEWVLANLASWKFELTSSLHRSCTREFTTVHLTQVTSIIPDFTVFPIDFGFDCVPALLVLSLELRRHFAGSLLLGAVRLRF